MRFFVSLAALALAAAVPPSFAQSPPPPDDETITVTGTPRGPWAQLRPVAIRAVAVPLDPTDPARDRVGRLRYLGGFHLSSNDRRFGGLSGMRFTEGDRLLAVTDGGYWLALDLDESDHRLVGVGGAGMAIIRGPQREPLRGKSYADAEALEVHERGLAVAFERDHRIWHFRDVNAGARPELFPDERWLAGLPDNAGIEAMAKVGDAWLFLAEEPMTEGRQEGVLVARRGLSRAYAPVAVPTQPGYRPTDAQALDDRRVMLLSRRFSPITREEVRIDIVDVDARRLALGKVEPVAAMALPMTVDNMEALTVRHDGGRTFVYIASDDNFSPIQRTLLMKFELLP